MPPSVWPQLGDFSLQDFTWYRVYKQVKIPIMNRVRDTVVNVVIDQISTLVSNHIRDQIRERMKVR